MYKYRKIFYFSSILLLLINGVGAIYGGALLIIDPAGNKLRMSIHVLDHTPFHNFFIPGIILFVVNGIFSVAIVFAILLKLRNYALLVFAEGILLTGWIITQYMLTETYHPLQVIMGSIGLLLMICSYELNKYREHA